MSAGGGGAIARRGPFRDMPREVVALSSVSFTVALGYGIVAPAIPAFARQFGVSTAAAAGVISAFALTRILGALPAGRLADRVGERATMAAGIAVVAASSAAAGFSGSFAGLIVLRGVGGLGSAAFSVSAQALLLRSVPAGLRGRASGLYSGGFLLGGITGPAIGGLVAAWSLRAPFFIYGGMLLIPALIAAVIPGGQAGHRGAARRKEPGGRAGGRGGGAGEPRADRRGPRWPSARPGPAWRSGAYRAAAAANLADGFAVMGVRSAIVPLFVRDVLHRPATWTGIGFGVVAALNAAALLPAGRIADTLGRRPVVVAGCLASAAGMAALALAPSPGGFIAALALIGAGSGLLDVGPAAIVGDLLGGQGGTMVAAYQMAGDAGTVAGPVAVGFLVDAVSYPAAFGLAGSVLVVAAALGLSAGETREPAGAAAGPGAARPPRPPARHGRPGSPRWAWRPTITGQAGTGAEAGRWWRGRDGRREPEREQR